MFEDYESQLTNKKTVIHVQKRNNSKFFTIISGWSETMDVKKICTHLKKKLQCGGHIVEDEVLGKVMTFTGDHKQKIYDFLMSEKICSEEDIIIKGI
jgi:translation initiation factor SUI1